MQFPGKFLTYLHVLESCLMRSENGSKTGLPRSECLALSGRSRNRPIMKAARKAGLEMVVAEVRLNSVQPPRNCGGRLATKAAIPSCASSVLLAATIESLSAVSWSGRPVSNDCLSMRRTAPKARVGPAASLADHQARGSSPKARAYCAVRRRFSRKSSCARRCSVSLEKDAPVSRAVDRAGRILCRPILGGLHHRYARI
jgi:hypothetical protein